MKSFYRWLLQRRGYRAICIVALSMALAKLLAPLASSLAPATINQVGEVIASVFLLGLLCQRALAFRCEWRESVLRMQRCEDQIERLAARWGGE